MPIRSIHLMLLATLLAAGCASQPPENASQDWIETQLFFGLTGPGGMRITAAQWHGFVDQQITSRFPDGLTIVYGDGQFRTPDGAIGKEPCAILILLHPAGDDAKINAIARAYDVEFHQDSVLRADVNAKTAFISATQP
jgi:hypothetical protein